MAFPVPTEPAAAKPAEAAPAAEAKPPTPLRGMRLATSEPEAGAEPPPDDEPPDPAGPGSRPSLKRIK